MTNPKIQTNAGEIELVQIDEDSRQIAEEDSKDGQWQKGDEVVLADRDGYGWSWVPTKAIQE